MARLNPSLEEKSIIETKGFNQADIYIWIYIIYQLQGIIYPKGIINQCFILVFFIISFVVSARCLIIHTSRPILINVTSLLIWMYIIYGSVLVFVNPFYPEKNTPVYFYLQNALISLLPICAFYIYFRRGLIGDKKIQFYALPLLILCILHYFRQEDEVIRKLAENGQDMEEITNNVGYEFLNIIPLLLIVKRKVLRYFSLALVSVFILSGFKRGAILILAVCIIYIFFFELKRAKSGKKRFLSLIFSLLLILGLIFYINYLYHNSPYFLQRIESTQEGNTSNRNEIYTKIWYAFLDGNLRELILGHGADSTFEASGSYAHQDWLQILYDNGLLGAILLTLFYTSIVISIYKIKNFISNRALLSFNTLFIICILKTIFSMSILDMPISLTVLIGYLAFLNQNKDKNTKGKEDSKEFDLLTN